MRECSGLRGEGAVGKGITSVVESTWSSGRGGHRGEQAGPVNSLGDLLQHGPLLLKAGLTGGMCPLPGDLLGSPIDWPGPQGQVHCNAPSQDQA